VLTELVLVRHAESQPPEPGLPDPPERPLTAGGLLAARELVPALLALRPDVVVSSPLRRAWQTVEPLARALGAPVAVRDDLREWDSGLVPDDSWAEAYAWSWDNPSLAHDGGESLDDLTERALTVLRDLAETHRGSVVVVGTHGTFLSRALGGLGHDVDWPFCHGLPSPVVYRVRSTPRYLTISRHR
jgi:2,3-bisphosphoglycerate-dependent phosphoglycerate mutase